MDIINARITNPSSDECSRRGAFHPLFWTSRREMLGKLHGNSNLDRGCYSSSIFHKGLYNSFGHSMTWNNASGNPYHYGAIFNFDFSPDGSTLVAASERRSILMFDPLTQKMFKAKTNAHENCVNVVKFIDDRLFSTCSDDRSVKIWDLRNTDKELQTLNGHSNWVKNIECVDGKLLTSGFDGNIITWDYNRYHENNDVRHEVLFQTRNLMRTALSPDKSKLVLSTSSGYIMVVHDLDISTLAQDLKGFKPNIYRLMQMNPSADNSSIAFNHLFQESRTKNRLELITDFAENFDVEIIASLKIHPSGNYILSRNTSSDEQHEHTCVHDLQYHKQQSRARANTEEKQHIQATSAASNTQYLLSLAVDNTSNAPVDLSTRRRHDLQATASTSQRDRSRSPLRETSFQDSLRNTSLDRSQSELISKVLPGAQQRLDMLAANYAATNEQFMIFIQGNGDGVHQTLVLFADDRRTVKRPQTNTKNGKLRYFVEEPNMGKGFIKEPCFSYDGRIVCSPFAHGVRLLSIDNDCGLLEDKDMPMSNNRKPTELNEVASVYSHQNLVVATKYSPTHHLLVTGCLDGQVCFYKPTI